MQELSFFYFVTLKFFCFALVNGWFNILRKIFLTSLGLFHTSFILLEVFLDSSCSAKQLKMKSLYQKPKSEIEMG